MLNVVITGDKELIAKLDAMPARVREALIKKVTALSLKLEDKVKRKLNGEVLNHRTGKLWRSITHKVESDSQSITGRVFSSGDVKYAAIHEFGGKTSPHVIEARNGKALAFQLTGKQAFFRKVNHPGSTIPERSFLRSSLADMKDEIVDGLKEAVAEGTRL